MLTIRFSRVGKKNKAQFKITLQEHTVAPGGRHIEILGSYDPHKKSAVLKDERIKYWLAKGAKASDTVHNLLVSKGIVSAGKRVVKIPKKVEEAKTEEAKEGAKVEKAKEAKEEIKETKKEEAKEEKPAKEIDKK